MFWNIHASCRNVSRRVSGSYGVSRDMRGGFVSCVLSCHAASCGVTGSLAVSLAWTERAASIWLKLSMLTWYSWMEKGAPCLLRCYCWIACESRASSKGLAVISSAALLTSIGYPIGNMRLCVHSQLPVQCWLTAPTDTLILIQQSWDWE